MGFKTHEQEQQEQLTKLLGKGAEKWKERLREFLGYKLIDPLGEKDGFIARYLSENRVEVLPCRVGETVYIIDKDLLDASSDLGVSPGDAVWEDEVYEMTYGMDSHGVKDWSYLVVESGMDFYGRDVGVTVFFTEAEALEAVNKAIEKKGM